MSDEALSAKILAGAKALVVAAGAGMGVDSGLPDFRGTEGFWRAYPPLRELGIRFEEMANPAWFSRDPQLAWGFYGHRLALYRRTIPHDGFGALRRFGEAMKHGAFVFTSNVDGQFQRAGFHESRVHECHGSLLHLQCTRCDEPIWSAEGVTVEIDETTFRANGELPRCAACGALARPNVLMFGDGGWDPSRSDRQEGRLRSWLTDVTSGDLRDVAVVECGAGTAVPSVRSFTENLARAGARLVRINVREPEVPAGDHVGIASGALVSLQTIERLLAGG